LVDEISSLLGAPCKDVFGRHLEKSTISPLKEILPTRMEATQYGKCPRVFET